MSRPHSRDDADTPDEDVPIFHSQEEEQEQEQTNNAQSSPVNEQIIVPSAAPTSSGSSQLESSPLSPIPIQPSPVDENGLPAEFRYASASRKGSNATSATVSNPSADAQDSLTLLSDGAIFTRFEMEDFHRAGRDGSTVDATPSRIQLFCAPVQKHVSDASLWWTVLPDNASPSNETRVQTPGQCLALQDVTDVFKGATTPSLKAAIALQRHNPPVTDELCFAFRSSKHCLSLVASSTATRDAWVAALCNILETSFHRRRTIIDPDSLIFDAFGKSSPSPEAIVRKQEDHDGTGHLLAVVEHDGLQPLKKTIAQPDGDQPKQSQPSSISRGSDTHAIGAASTQTDSSLVIPASAPAHSSSNNHTIHSVDSVDQSKSTAANSSSTVSAPATAPALTRAPSFSLPAPSGPQLEVVEALASEKAHQVHDLRLTLVQMVKEGTDLLMQNKEFLTKDGRNEPTDVPSRKEYDLQLKRESKDFTYVTVPKSSNIVFEAKSYAPTIFKRIRMLYNISDERFLASVAHPSKGYNDLIVNSKSGSLFFYSHDNQYLIKSCTVQENKTLVEHMLQSYYQHLKAYPDSLLIKLLGSFRLTIKKPHKETLHFFVMKNVFASPVNKPIHVRFDLKGSTYGRKAKKTELQQEIPVLKDTDFFEGATFPDGRVLPPTYLYLGSQKKELLLKQLALDGEFLRRQEIIDYSLLVGISYADAKEPAAVKPVAGTGANGDSGASTANASTTHNTPALLSQPAQSSDSGVLALSASHQLNGSVPPANLSSTEAQTNYGLKPKKEILIPRQLLRRATIALLSEDEKQQIHDIGRKSARREAEREEKHSHPPIVVPPEADSSSPSHEVDSPPPPLTTRKSLLLESDGGILSESEDPAHDRVATYYLGVIDILQQYTTFKKFEATIKGLTISSTEVSCTDPYSYLHRFVTRISSHFIGADSVSPLIDPDEEMSDSRLRDTKNHMTLDSSPVHKRTLLQPETGRFRQAQQ